MGGGEMVFKITVPLSPTTTNWAPALSFNWFLISSGITTCSFEDILVVPILGIILLQQLLTKNDQVITLTAISWALIQEVTADCRPSLPAIQKPCPATWLSILLPDGWAFYQPENIGLELTFDFFNAAFFKSPGQTEAGIVHHDVDVLLFVENVSYPC